jgi:acetyl esterase/lipase
MKTIYSLVLIAGTFFYINSVAQTTEKVLDPVVAITTQSGFSSNITFLKIEGHDLKLDVVVPRINLGESPWWKIDSTPKPALLYIHGGGWVEGEKETRLLGLLPFVSKGWVVVNINYRLAQDVQSPTDMVADCRNALNWIYDNAKRFQMDTSRIVVAGESAGGHLALMTGLLNNDTPINNKGHEINRDLNVAAIINWFGVTDFNAFEAPLIKEKFGHINWVAELSDMDSLNNIFSPVSYIVAESVPVLTIHGDADPVVPYQQAEILTHVLNDHGVKNKLLTIPGKKHGNFSAYERTHIFKQIWNFLESVGIETEAIKKSIN